jgi:hypothetical protein
MVYATAATHGGDGAAEDERGDRAATRVGAQEARGQRGSQTPSGRPDALTKHDAFLGVLLLYSLAQRKL